MKQPTFFTRQDMERIAEQDIDPALLPSDEIARKIEENDIHISVTINKQKANMTDYTIPMIIGMALAFALGAGLGGLWGLSRHEWLYCRVTAHLTWRMREAMKSLGIQEWQIDKAQEYMGSAIIPPHIPMPEPQVKPERDFDKEPYTMDEVVRRLSPQGDRAGEWYCTSRQRRMAWRIDMVDAEGLIVRKLVHDMREHTISKAPETCKPETVEQLARKIIDYNFRFLDDFDRKEWD